MALPLDQRIRLMGSIPIRVFFRKLLGTSIAWLILSLIIGVVYLLDLFFGDSIRSVSPAIPDWVFWLVFGALALYYWRGILAAVAQYLLQTVQLGILALLSLVVLFVGMSLLAKVSGYLSYWFVLSYLMLFVLLELLDQEVQTLLVTQGKTAAARRLLPFTPRVRAVLEGLWEAEGRPIEGWVWSSGTRSGHIESCTLKKQHRKALRLSGVRPFVLYSLRHTFLTRLGGSGCDAWTLARIAGHSSVSISTRYVHPSEDAVLAAVEMLGGHNSRHTPRKSLTGTLGEKLLSVS